MVPATDGGREFITPLDLAILRDLGYWVTDSLPDSLPPLAATGDACGADVADCFIGVCAADGRCAQCGLDRHCVNGACDVGNQGAPCRAAGDCAMGFSCTAGFCEAALN